MARQYFNSLLTDPLISPVSAVSPGTTATFLLSNGSTGLTGQSPTYMPLPYGANHPLTGQVFRFGLGGLFTSVAGTFIFNVYHGSGTSSTAGGTALGASQTLTPTAFTAGYFRLEGELIYRTISELATSSTVWCSWHLITGGPPANTNACQVYLGGTASAVSVDTTGQGSAGTYGALNVFVTPGTTGSSFTPEYAFVYSLN
jgi:hypothetical protein